MTKLLLCSLLLSGLAFAQQTGNEFLQECAAIEKSSTTDTDKLKSTFCAGYVSGVLDGIMVGSGLNHDHEPEPFCMPSEVTTGQAVRVVLKFIRDHPADAHHTSRILIFEAMRENYPCSPPKK
jgi:hypothetical protein